MCSSASLGRFLASLLDDVSVPSPVFSLSLSPLIEHDCPQAVLGELRQARNSLKDAEEGRERALVATEQAKRHFIEVESGWRREAKDLRAALNETVRGSGKDAEVSQQTAGTSEVQPSSFQESQDVVAGDLATQNEAPQASASGASDATSRDLAQELLQKLTDETKQRRSTRQALSDQVHSYGG